MTSVAIRITKLHPEYQQSRGEKGMNENEEREPYEKPELAKLDNIKELTAYDCNCAWSIPGGL